MDGSLFVCLCVCMCVCSESLTAAVSIISMLWHFTPCNHLKINWRFGETWSIQQTKHGLLFKPWNRGHIFSWRVCWHSTEYTVLISRRQNSSDYIWFPPVYGKITFDSSFIKCSYSLGNSLLILSSVMKPVATWIMVSEIHTLRQSRPGSIWSFFYDRLLLPYIFCNNGKRKVNFTGNLVLYFCLFHSHTYWDAGT
jgi:hypothetical protein